MFGIEKRLVSGKKINISLNLQVASALLSTGLGSNFSTLAEHQNNRHNISDDLQSLSESELNYFVGPSLTWTNLTTGGGPLRPQIRNVNSYLDFISN